MSKSVAKKSAARQRIVDTAERLFYAEGLRAVGIDRIIAESSVAKMTLYKHFASKDDLILSALEQRDQTFADMFEQWMQRHQAKGLDRFEAVFAALKSWFDSDSFRGCMFINSSVELADPAHQGSKFSATHKERFSAMLMEVIAEIEGKKVARALTPSIALLIEGAIVSAVMQNSSKPALVAKKAALALLAARQ